MPSLGPYPIQCFKRVALINHERKPLPSNMGLSKSEFSYTNSNKVEVINRSILYGLKEKTQWKAITHVEVSIKGVCNINKYIFQAWFKSEAQVLLY